MRRHLTKEEQALIVRLKEYLQNPAGFAAVKTYYSPKVHARPPVNSTVVEAAEERGRARNLKATVSQLLTELGEAPGGR